MEYSSNRNQDLRAVLRSTRGYRGLELKSMFIELMKLKDYLELLAETSGKYATEIKAKFQSALSIAINGLDEADKAITEIDKILSITP